MKLQSLLGVRTLSRLPLLVVAVAMGASPLMAADAPLTNSAPATEAVANVPAQVALTGPTREVVKLSVSGISQDVIKAYIYHSPSFFNLTADSIIHLKGVGVTPDVLAAMLNRDTMLRDRAALNARPGTPAPMVQPSATASAPPPSTVATTTVVPEYSSTVVAPPYYYYPDYAYDYPYYGYPYGYYGGWYFTGGHRWWGPRFGFGVGRPFGGRGFVGGGSGGGRSSGGGHVGRH